MDWNWSLINWGAGEAAIGMGMLMVATAWMLHRSALRQGAQTTNSLAAAQRSLAEIERSPEAELVRLQVRLHDEVRELEARIAMRLGQLTEQMAQADRLAQELRGLIADVDQRRMPLNQPAPRAFLEESDEPQAA